MKKAFLIMLFTAITAAVVFAQNVKLPRLAVVTFAVNTEKQKAREDAIAIRNFVQSNMVSSGKYDVITRDEIDKLLENQRIQVSSISSSENIKKLQLQNISYIVTGTVDALDNDYGVTISILDVSTGRFTHSTSQFMSNTSADIYNKTAALVRNFQQGLSNEGETVVQTGTGTSGISIVVSTKEGGDLYLNEEKIASVFDNDTYTIPIEKPGIYSLRMELPNKMSKIASVTITSRGVTRIDFSNIPSAYVIGKIGPAGGIVFYDKGNASDGWRYLEAAPASAEFKSNWNSAEGICNRMSIEGFTGGWRLPSDGELNLMYENLKLKGLGGFNNDWYWSSNPWGSGGGGAQVRNFGNGSVGYHGRSNVYSVRAVRAF